MSTTNHRILKDTAVKMTRAYRNNKEEILKPEYAGKNILPLSETFSKEAFESFMKNDKVKSLRIYYGMDDDMLTHAIIVGANEKDEDMIDGTDENDGDEILEDAQRCPAICPPPSELNYP